MDAHDLCHYCRGEKSVGELGECEICTENVICENHSWESIIVAPDKSEYFHKLCPNCAIDALAGVDIHAVLDYGSRVRIIA